jgi:hypothetical protein
MAEETLNQTPIAALEALAARKKELIDQGPDVVEGWNEFYGDLFDWLENESAGVIEALRAAEAAFKTLEKIEPWIDAQFEGHDGVSEYMVKVNKINDAHDLINKTLKLIPENRASKEAAPDIDELVADDPLWSWNSNEEGDIFINLVRPIKLRIPMSRRDIERMDAAGDTRMRMALKSMRERDEATRREIEGASS